MIFVAIQQIELEFMLVFFRDDLHAEFPFGIRARFDRFPQIAAVKIRIFAGNLLRFVPHDRMHAEKRFPVKFDETRLCLRR